jgi:hypothetical protein
MLLHAVQAEAPKVTGAFAASMYPTVSITEGEVMINISASSKKPKSIWISNGTMGHEIGAGGNFLWNPTGDTEFAAMGPVVHPGTHANQFGMRALAIVRPQLLASLARDVSAAMQVAVAETRK